MSLVSATKPILECDLTTFQIAIADLIIKQTPDLIVHYVQEIGDIELEYNDGEYRDIETEEVYDKNGIQDLLAFGSFITSDLLRFVTSMTEYTAFLIDGMFYTTLPALFSGERTRHYRWVSNNEFELSSEKTTFKTKVFLDVDPDESDYSVSYRIFESSLDARLSMDNGSLSCDSDGLSSLRLIESNQYAISGQALLDSCRHLTFQPIELREVSSNELCEAVATELLRNSGPVVANTLQSIFGFDIRYTEDNIWKSGPDLYSDKDLHNLIYETFSEELGKLAQGQKNAVQSYFDLYSPSTFKKYAGSLFCTIKDPLIAPNQGFYFSWYRNKQDDSGLTYLKLEDENELNLSELIFATPEDAIEGLKQHPYDLERDMGDIVLVATTERPIAHNL